MDRASALFRLLGDAARLRLLRVLSRDDRFNVSELTAVLGLAQSGVSRHLGLLKEAGLVREQRDGGYTYFRLAPDLAPDSGRPIAALLAQQFAEGADTAAVRQDEARLQEVLRLRRENFDVHAGADTRDGRQLVPGRSWAAWARALGHLLPPLDVADLGCGEGYLTVEIARWAKHVVAIDRSATVLSRARALAGRRRVTNITWKKGDLLRLPLPDAAVDVALLSQALHHAGDPDRALAEAARIVRPGGRVLLLDLREHQEHWVRERLGDLHLGFEDSALRKMLERAGLQQIRTQVGSRNTGDPFTVLIASGTRPLHAGSAVRRFDGSTEPAPEPVPRRTAAPSHPRASSTHSRRAVAPVAPKDQR